MRRRSAQRISASKKRHDQFVSRLVELVGPIAQEHDDVPPSTSTFDDSDVQEFAGEPAGFWTSAASALHQFAPQENAIPSISVLLDFAIAVFRAVDEEWAVKLFALQEEAFQVLPLAQARRLIAYLELRREDWVKHAQGEASIVLLRTGRTLLNRLEPKLYALDTGRVIAYLALSKGMAHASRVNRKGLSFNPGPTPASAGDEDSIEYAVYQLQNAGSLAASPNPEPFLHRVLHRFTRLTLAADLGEARSWSALTWEDAEKTLNGLIFVFLTIYALPALRKTTHEGARQLIEELEAQLDKIIASVDGLSAAVDRLMARESEWSSWRQEQYAKRERSAVEVPAAEAEPASTELAVPPLEPSLGNENLTRLWSVPTGLERFKESIDWPAKAQEFEAMGTRDDATFKYLALRCRPWAELVSTFASAPVEEHDLSEWEAKLPKSPTPVPPSKRASEQPEPAPKRARLAYEDVDRGAGDRQRVMTTTARPLPY